MPTGNHETRPPNVTQPTVARIYEYFLGGSTRYTTDVTFARRMSRMNPYLEIGARHNREFLKRATRYLTAECGIKQFLDIGSGIPTAGNIHRVAAEAIPDARVVYVDNNTEAVNLFHQLLTAENNANAVSIQGDLREPDTILNHPDTQRLIDFSQPVGLMLVAVWHFIPDDKQAYELMAHYRDQLAPDSYVAMSHVSLDDLTGEVKERCAAINKAYAETANPVTPRGREQFTAFFDGLTLVDPGITYCPDWRPVEPVDIDDPVRPWGLAGVARKP